MKKRKSEGRDVFLIAEEKTAYPRNAKKGIREWKKDDRKKIPVVDIVFESLMASQISVPQWKKAEESFSAKEKISEFDLVSNYKLLVFAMEGDSIKRNKWANLPQRPKEVFKEILDLFPIRKSACNETDGCYTFSYADSDSLNMSILFMVSKNNAVFFYGY